MWGYLVDCHGESLCSTQDPKWNFKQKFIHNSYVL